MEHRPATLAAASSFAAHTSYRSRRTSAGINAVQEAVIPLVDKVEPSARAIHSVNTIVNDDGHLTASNTDYIAVQRLIDEHGLDPDDAVLIRGSGGMASAVGAAFRDSGFHSGIVVARNPEAGRALADRLGYEYAPDVGDRIGADHRERHADRDGRRPGRDATRHSTQATIAKAHTVFDVVALPSETR